jgi:RNA polymerase sigma-70 factor (ECF subfamily)
MSLDQTDRELVRRMLSADERAFETFFDDVFPRLFRFAVSRLGNADSAEEVAQATLVLAVRKLETWRGEAALLTWVCTLCRHEITAFRRRSGQDPLAVVGEDDPQVRASLESLPAAIFDAPDARFESAERTRLVHLTLDWLPAHYADIIEWKYLEGLTVAEIADRLRTSEKTIESRLTRAREAFRDGFASLTRNTVA